MTLGHLAFDSRLDTMRQSVGGKTETEMNDDYTDLPKDSLLGSRRRQSRKPLPCFVYELSLFDLPGVQDTPASAADILGSSTARMAEVHDTDAAADAMATGEGAGTGLHTETETNVHVRDGMVDRSESQGDWLPCTCGDVGREYAEGAAGTAMGRAFCRYKGGIPPCERLRSEMLSAGGISDKEHRGDAGDKRGEVHPHDERVSWGLDCPICIAAHEQRKEVSPRVRHDGPKKGYRGPGRRIASL